jgi:hypothetical protein
MGCDDANSLLQDALHRLLDIQACIRYRPLPWEDRKALEKHLEVIETTLEAFYHWLPDSTGETTDDDEEEGVGKPYEHPADGGLVKRRMVCTEDPVTGEEVWTDQVVPENEILSAPSGILGKTPADAAAQLAAAKRPRVVVK